ncbi:MAG: EAL domain-containing protein [Candidatus Competibacteraceae bacterium]|jgi:diguanylate cyclase (GGDEF)-like protein/PAS domain S-box-containing protein|nr:EAL domain-containing protein [Candidatus Competibacteraceae bacterium]
MAQAQASTPAESAILFAGQPIESVTTSTNLPTQQASTALGVTLEPVLPNIHYWMYVGVIAFLVVAIVSGKTFIYKLRRQYAGASRFDWSIVLENKKHLSAALEAINEGIWEWNFQKGSIRINSRYLTQLGYTPDITVLTEENWRNLLHPSDMELIFAAIQAHFKGQAPIYEAEYRIRSQTGWMWVLDRGKVIVRNPHGQPLRMLGTQTDISRRKLAEAALQREKERLRVTLHSIGEAVITTDASDRVDYLNPRAAYLTGWPLAEVRGKRLADIFRVSNEDETAIDPISLQQQNQLDNPLVLFHRDGSRYVIQVSLTAIRDEQQRGMGSVLVFRDITLERNRVQEMSYYASHDPLTGLVNRREFEHQLYQVVATASQQQSEHVLCYLDLDKFKSVNDVGGHMAGDGLLRQIGTLLGGLIRRGDTLARLGGDEFGLLMENCSLTQADRVINAIRQAVKEYCFIWQDNSFRIGVSIGIVPITATSEGAAELLKAADTACYMAKDEGRDRVHIYRPENSGRARQYKKVQWASRINSALEQDRLRLYSQLIVPLDSRNQQNVYHEILLRLEDENGELVLPNAFLGAAERYKMLLQLDRWVISHTFEWLAAHPQQTQRTRLCNINLADQSLRDKNLSRFVQDKAQQTAVPADKICFEISELAMLSQSSDVIDFINALKPLRFQFALDDFSGRLPTFSYLNNVSVDYLKLDSAFLRNISTLPIASDIVRSVNELSHRLGKKTIAKFVENAAALEALKLSGVDYAQGNYLGTVQPLDAMLGDASHPPH